MLLSKKIGIMHNLNRFGILAVLLVLGLLNSSCGDSADSTTSGDSSTAEIARQKMEEAGSNIEDLNNVRNWIKGKIAAGDPDDLDLQLLSSDTASKIVSSFKKLVQGVDESNPKKAAQLRHWAEKIIDAEKGKAVGERDPLAKSLAKQMDYLWEIALKADPNNNDLRRQLGYVEDTKDLTSYLSLPFMDEDKDIKIIEDLIEAVAEASVKSPDGKKWLPKDFPKMKAYKGIDDLVAKRKAEHEEKLKDPFTKAAYQLLAETKEYLKNKKNLSSYKWVGRVHHPYLFIVERDSGWNESKIAEKKGKQMDELIHLFHGEYSKTFKLKEITSPMPIVIFKRLSSYRQYAVGKTLQGALGHFEHGSDRIILSDEAGRDTMYHEGTHQLITYHTKGDTVSNFLSRSYWFQEGVAEYFGGTAAFLDPKTKELRFELGVLQGGRLNGWRQNEEAAYTLWQLLGLTFADRQMNIANGKQNKNLMVYAQGWLLVYFLYNFNVNDKDMVLITDRPTGKYKQGFLTYMKGELDGKTGRDFFLKCLGLWDENSNSVDLKKWEKFELEYNRYYNWLNRKLVMRNHVLNRKLIPWQKVTNKGKMIGDEEDDILPVEVLPGTLADRMKPPTNDD